MHTQFRSLVQAKYVMDLGRYVNFRSVVGATLCILLLRALIGLWVVQVSAVFPETALERQIDVRPGSAPTSMWLQRVLVDPWLRSDALWYQRIAEHGYLAGEGTAAFHPFYPLLVRCFALLLGGNTGLALLLVATLSSIGLVVLFARYVEHFYGEALSAPACWLLLAGPLGFVLLAPYTESTFLLLSLGSFWAMRNQRWWWAGLLGCLASLTRQQGLALALPLAWGVLSTMRARRIAAWNIAAVALVPLGYALFIIYRMAALGDLNILISTRDPVAFLDSLLVSQASEHVVPGQRIAWPWEPLIDEIRLIFTKSYNIDLLIDITLGWAGVLVILVGLRRMPVEERLYSLAIVMLSLCYYNGSRSPYLALPRHILLAWPLFIVLALWAGRGTRMRVLMTSLFLVNLFLALLFVCQGWIP